jgi:signal transduction histidine kinase
MLVFRLILIIFSLHITVSQMALASTIIQPTVEEQDISREFEKEAHGLSPVETKNQKGSLRYGYFSGEKWAGITLSNPGDTIIKKLLYFETLTGYLTLFEQNGSNRIQMAVAGSSIPYVKRDVKSIFAAFNIELPAHTEKKYLFKIISRHNFNSKVYVGDEKTLRAREETKLNFLDFYCGGILCLIIYNFFIFLFLKDKNYLFYCFFSGSFVLPILTIHGVMDRLLKPQTFSFSHHLICFSSFALICATIFTYYFLEIKKHLPKFSLYYKIFFGISVSLLFIGLTPLEDLWPQVFGRIIDFTLVISNLMFIINSVMLRKITSVARFYLFSWMVVFISLISWFGMTFGFFPNNFFTQHSLLYANLGQMLTLSLALAFRIHELTQQKIAAEEKGMQKEKYQRLVRVLSHDIANSLTIINSYSKKLVRQQNLEPQLQRIMEKVYLASENIKNILNNVREEELLSLRKKEIDRELVSIMEVVNNAAGVFEDLLKLKRIELVVEVEQEHIILANKTCLLNNIVNNILSNSIKFSFENSKIEIASSRDSGKIQIVFKDYGRGIKQELIQDIFFSNTLISSQGTNAEVGHGFGTTLMREYVTLFNGEMMVTSSENEAYNGQVGTQVILRFPEPETLSSTIVINQ